MDQQPRVAVIRTGTANLASIVAAFDRLQIKSNIVETASELRGGDLLVLPGVGAFRTGMSALIQNGWESVLRQRLDEDLPTLAICLGLQLLCEGSEENPDVAGLG